MLSFDLKFSSSKYPVSTSPVLRKVKKRQEEKKKVEALEIF